MSLLTTGVGHDNACHHYVDCRSPSHQERHNSHRHSMEQRFLRREEAEQGQLQSRTWVPCGLTMPQGDGLQAPSAAGEGPHSLPAQNRESSGLGQVPRDTGSRRTTKVKPRACKDIPKTEIRPVQVVRALYLFVRKSGPQPSSNAAHDCLSLYLCCTRNISG